MSEHQTPRIEAVINASPAIFGATRLISFARELERESADRLALLLAAELREKRLREALTEIEAAPMAAFDSFQGALDRVKAKAASALAEPASPSPELAGLLADRERIDACLTPNSGLGLIYADSRNTPCVCRTREDIDAARAARKGTP